MHEYLLMLRYDLYKLKNYILDIKRHPKKLISYFLFLAWMVLILLPNLNSRSHLRGMWQETADVALGVVSLMVILIFYRYILNALQKPAFSFTMGDVNLLFPSPIKPNRILLWNMIKKIPASLAVSAFPLIFLTPTLSYFGVNGEGFLLLYLAVVLLSLILPSTSFLIFMLSTRFRLKRIIWMVTLLSVVWISGSWLLETNFNFASLQTLKGYSSAGILGFPVIGWVIQLAAIAFGITQGGSLVFILLLGLTLLVINLIAYTLAHDYYEDVLDYAAEREKIRESKRQGIKGQQGIWFGRRGKMRKVSVNKTYLGSRAFMYRQIVMYRKTGFNEFVGYAALAALFVGFVGGIVVNNFGLPAQEVLIQGNSFIAYFLILRTTSNEMNQELLLPYLYTLPGNFSQKIMAITLIPLIRFTIAILLSNIAFVLIADLNWVNALLFTLVLGALYFEVNQMVAVGYAILPGSLDRKLFYPLLVFSQLLLIGIPGGIAGGVVYFLGGSLHYILVGIFAISLLIGFLLIRLAEPIFKRIEISEV